MKPLKKSTKQKKACEKKGNEWYVRGCEPFKAF